MADDRRHPPRTETEWGGASRWADESPTIIVGIAPPAPRPPPISDWYDGKPKLCPGSGSVPRLRFMGQVDGNGDRLYHVRCDWCDTPQEPGEPMPEHTFIPVDPDTITFTTGKILEGIEYTHCPGCGGRILPGVAVTHVEDPDPFRSLWHTGCVNATPVKP